MVIGSGNVRCRNREARTASGKTEAAIHEAVRNAIREDRPERCVGVVPAYRACFAAG